MTTVTNKPRRAFTGSVRISVTAFKRMEKAAANPPRANKALKDLVRKGESILKKG